MTVIRPRRRRARSSRRLRDGYTTGTSKTSGALAHAWRRTASGSSRERTSDGIAASARSFARCGARARGGGRGGRRQVASNLLTAHRAVPVRAAGGDKGEEGAKRAEGRGVVSSPRWGRGVFDSPRWGRGVVTASDSIIAVDRTRRAGSCEAGSATRGQRRRDAPRAAARGRRRAA